MTRPLMLAAIVCMACQCAGAEPWQDMLMRADELAAAGEIPAAVNLAEKALDLVQNSPVSCDTCAARIYQTLGRYHFGNDLAETERCYVQALALRERSLGPNHADVALCQANLGRVYVQEGRYQDAQALFKKALAIQKRNFGPISRGVARTLNSLGDVSRVLCDYHESERCYQDALVACRGWAGSDSVAAMVYNNLGVLYQEEGRRPEAEQQYLQALDLYDSASCQRPLRLAVVVNNLARLWHEAGRYPDAERLYQQALGLFVEYAGGMSPDVARGLNNLAFLWIQTGNLDQAEQALNEAMVIQRSIFGPNHPALAASMNNLAYVEIRRGNFASAEALMNRAISINERIGTAQEKSLAENLRGIAEIKIGKRDYEGARRYARRAFELSLSSFRRAMGTFIERVAILSSMRVKGDAAFYLTTLIESPNGTDTESEEIGSAILNTKGIIADAMAARTWTVMNSVHISSCKDSLDEVSRIIQGQRQGGGASGSSELQQLYIKRDRYEAEIARRQSAISERHAAGDVRVEQVAGALPDNGVLIEYLKYRHGTGLKSAESRYVAMVLPARGPMRVVNLGSADSIDAQVARYREYFRSPGDRNATEYASVSAKLYDLVWRPVEPWIQGTARVILAPDGELNLVSFAGLKDASGKYLIEQFSIHYCGSGRDLLRQTEERESGYGLLALGDPVFGDPASADETRLEDTSIWQKLLSVFRGPAKKLRAQPKLDSLPRLPGTRREVDAVCALWKSTSPEPMTPCFGAEATEYAFRHLSGGKRIVYVATHGFSLSDDNAPTDETNLWSEDDPHYIGDNPLTLSGLALASGSGREVKENTELNPSECDGILSAEDMASLNLMSADLVVLSACETGLGTVISGEGIYGLRRATLVAGARTVISTLWSVDDEATSALMSQFFAHRGGDIPEMMQSVQIEQLQKVRTTGDLDDPFKWAPFVVTGAWDWR